MANALAEIYSQTSLISIDRFIEILENETDPKRLSDLTAQLNAAAKIDSENGLRRTFWEAASVWSTRRLGEILAGMPKNTGSKKTSKSAENSGGFTLNPPRFSDLGIEKNKARRAQQLAAVPEEAIAAYVEAAKEGGHEITLAGAMRSGKPKRKKAAEKIVAGEVSSVAAAVKQVTEPASDAIVLDCLKGPVPDSLHEVFEGIDEFRSLMKTISDAKGTAKQLAEKQCGKRIDLQELTRLLEQARALLRFAMPYTECPKCRRKLEKKCPACNGAGWIHETMFKTSASDADKGWLQKRSA